MRMFLCWLAGCGMSATVGVVYGQQVKDWLKGIPAQARAEIQKYEDAIIAKVKAAL